MKFSLRTKLTAAFLAVTLMLFALISIFANFLLDKQFREYVIGQQEKDNLTIVSTIANRYPDWGNLWDADGLENIGVNALENGLMLRVMNKDGTILWDAMEHNSGMCVSIIQNMAQMMQNQYADFKGGYVEKLYPVIVDGNHVGNVAVGYYGPYFYSDNDIQFLNTLNKLLQLAAILAMLISLILGVYMARQLSIPIRRVTTTAGQIAQGNLADRVEERSTTAEIIDLTATINSLADTLEKQETLRKRLTADVAHELRTPLATLQSHLEAMIDGVWEADVTRLQSCHEETVRLSKIISSLEELTRYDSENLKLDIGWFNVAVLLQRIATNFESEFRKKDIKCILNVTEQHLEADEDKISQVFINLFSNALKFNTVGGSVHITLTGTDHQIQVVVQDTGTGIPAEDLTYLFERFFRSDKSRNRQTGGSGIGLAIVKSIIDAHHGQISVESVLDQGSVFTVRLPRNYAR